MIDLRFSQILACRLRTEKKVASLLPSLLLLFFLMSSAAVAQPDRGGISGRVLDSSGAVVPQTRVELINLNTGVKSETTSNGIGLYAIPNVPAGQYKAIFSKKGFKTAERQGLTILITEMSTLDVALETGEIGETVIVAATSTPLKSGNSLPATAIPGKTARDLPLSIYGGRKIEAFAYALTPAVEGDEWTSHIAGSPAFSKEVLIDGLSATAQIQGNVLESSPTMESIQEFNVQSAGLSSEYGHASAGVFNFALTSGANKIHGSAYYYGRNEALNANTWMNNWQLGQLRQKPGDSIYMRARDRQSAMGGSIGGPVTIPGLYDGKNRTFIFSTLEHYRQENLQIGRYDRTVPIPAFLDGDFSSLLTKTIIGSDALGRSVYSGQIFDPSTLHKVGSQWVAEPFAGNIIPQQRMSKVSGKIIDIYRKNYQPMLPGLTANNSAGPQSENPWFHQTLLTVKGDHAFSPAVKLSGSLIWTERPRTLLDQGGVWDPLAAEGAGGALARARKQEVTSRSLRLSNSWTMRPNLINTASFVFNRYRNPSISAQSEGNWQKHLGLQQSTGAGLFPEIDFGSEVNGKGITGIGYARSDYYVANAYIAKDTVDWNRGRHNVKFGGEFWAQQMNSHAGLDALSFNFSPIQTGIVGYPWSNQTGFGFAGFFLGEAQSGSKTVPFDLYGRRKYLALFFQDDFRIGSSLTFNLGLRWEQNRPLHEKFGRWANFNPALTNTALGVKGALEFLAGSEGAFEKQRDWKEFGPHIGMAYRFGNKLVFRGGYGLSYIPLGINYWTGIPYGFAPGYRGTNNQTAFENLPKFNWDAGYPDNFQNPTRDPNALTYGMVSIDERSLFAGYVQQYNIGLQYEMSKDMVVKAALTGNRGRRLHNGALKRNQPSKSSYEDPRVSPWAWVWDADSAASAGVSYPYSGFSNYAGVALQPFPQIPSETGGPLYFVGAPLGSSEYRSLQISLTRRFSHAVAAQISYNLSRATGNSETGFNETWDESAGIQDIGNLAESADTVLSYDQTHVLKGYIAFQLPFGRGRKFLPNAPSMLDAVAGGWEIACIFRYNSGNPLPVFPNVWYPGWVGAIYADYNPAIDLSRQFNGANFNPGVQNAPGNRYFNPAAFSNPEGNKLGNGKRLYSELRGFGYAGEDLGLIKHFRIGEGAGIQLRAELLNVFNRHYFANPNTRMDDADTFGYVTDTTGNPRIVQFGLRIDW
jgi:hypothetical protein